eukprot:TRINITY_DN30910_c0_g1_i1.p2 TRINITY_DN30910_c0_g1~~TRINITY_DN30910_c0_g1_i1.p2  ORF type:complete len:146 (+),score=40.28 TRINITY_DN30910_c0_g1_i1:204-641(+)
MKMMDFEFFPGPFLDPSSVSGEADAACGCVKNFTAPEERAANPSSYFALPLCIHEKGWPMTHDKVAQCISETTSYAPEKVFDCVHGSLGAAIRADGAALWTPYHFKTVPEFTVAGKVEDQHHGEDVIAHVCALYTGPKPAVCGAL